MNKINETSNVPGEFIFWCEGCKCHHLVWTKPHNNGSAVWGFNGSLEKPTFTPSILVRWPEGENRVMKVCHSFIREGKIEYLSDCTHELAGKTIELSDWKS